jgi:hypothetical protein
MRAEKKHFIFIAFCFCLFVIPGVLCTNVGGATATVEITARVLLTTYNIEATDITNNSGNITWMTNGLSNSTVEYGPDFYYGMSESDPEMVLSHRISLEGLNSGQMYHYRVVSFDSAGNQCESPDFNFTTLATGEKSVIGDSGGDGSFSTIGNIVGLPIVDLPIIHPALTIVSGSPIPKTADNLVAEPVVVVSNDKFASLSIDANTLLLDRDGQPVSSIDLTRIGSKDVPAVPKGSMFIFSGYAYQNGNRFPGGNCLSSITTRQPPFGRHYILQQTRQRIR